MAKSNTESEEREDSTPDLSIGGENLVRKSFTVNLVGEHYRVYALKGSVGLSLISLQKKGDKDPEKALKAVDHMIDSLFSKGDRKNIRARLDDPDDFLDISHISELLVKMIEAGVDSPST